MEINKNDLIKGFGTFVEGKRKEALYLKLFFFSVTAIIIAILYYAYSLANHALDKVIVVNTGGELLPIEAKEQSALYESLLTSHCYSVSFYANTFSVNNIKENQARASFLVNQSDLNAIIGKYQYDKAYSDVMNRGVVYRCDFDKIEQIVNVGNGSEYQVVFTSTLKIIDNIGTKKITVISKGTAIRVTPRFPENPTGFYFKNYTQEYYPLNQE